MKKDINFTNLARFEEGWSCFQHTKNCYKYFSTESTHKEASTTCSKTGV